MKNYNMCCVAIYTLCIYVYIKILKKNMYFSKEKERKRKDGKRERERTKL